MNEITTAYGSFEFTLIAFAIGLPLLSFLVSQIISEKYSWAMSIAGPFLQLIAAVAALLAAFTFWNSEALAFSIEWFHIGSDSFRVGVLLNNTSALMLGVVSLISFLVQLYSIGYMAGDKGERKYFGMLGLFTFAMLGIVLADNVLLIFVFWELVGFASYMLIGHWNEKPEAAMASMKAFLVNRVGDAGFVVGLMILWAGGAGFSIAGFEPAEPTLLNTVGALCIFAGVAGKSAQLPLLTWLPDAMEGPTPVSALIHAATMVAAGVFLLARVFVLFTPDALTVIALIGIGTALFAAAAALVQTDIKRILAYSTISQLGLMVTAVGVGSWEAAIFHLFTHAFFKAALFLTAGSVIHCLHRAQHQAHVHFDVQDIRNLGGLRKKLPFTFVVAIINASALAGIPFFSGFLSKEAILGSLIQWSGDHFNGRWIVVVLAFVVSFLTAMYMTRFIYKVFLGAEHATKDIAVSDAPMVMRIPLMVLTPGAIWLIVSWSPFSPDGWLFSSNYHSVGLTIISACWVFAAAALAYVILKRDKWPLSGLLFNGFYLDLLYSWLFVRPSLIVAKSTSTIDRRVLDGVIHFTAYAHVTLSHLAGWWDRAIVDGVVNGLASTARLTGSFVRSFQGGKIQLYIFWPAFAIIIFLIWSLI